MRRLNIEEANSFLASRDLGIGAWDQIRDVAEQPVDPNEWINCPAPRDALALYCFSHGLLRWLTPEGASLLQVDASTNLQKDEDFLLSRLLFCSRSGGLLVDSRSFLFETVGADATYERLLLGDVIHLLLLFGHHGEIVSVGAMEGRRLSIQDGYVYFF